MLLLSAFISVSVSKSIFGYCRKDGPIVSISEWLSVTLLVSVFVSAPHRRPRFALHRCLFMKKYRYTNFQSGLYNNIINRISVTGSARMSTLTTSSHVTSVTPPIMLLKAIEKNKFQISLQNSRASWNKCGKIIILMGMILLLRPFGTESILQKL